jgi:hypothetical protein
MGAFTMSAFLLKLDENPAGVAVIFLHQTPSRVTTNHTNHTNKRQIDKTNCMSVFVLFV